jgi:putative transposase
MANTYHQIYIQTVFAVKYRSALISSSWKEELHGVIGQLIRECNCKCIIVNGTEDHVHCFIGLKPSISISDLMQAVKGKSSKYINDRRLTTQKFEWQSGYGVFSYYQRDIDRIYKYILNQEEHHRVFTFREEYLKLLDEFKIDYEDKYIFQELI